MVFNQDIGYSLAAESEIVLLIIFIVWAFGFLLFLFSTCFSQSFARLEDYE